MKKKSLIILFILVLLGIGFFVYTNTTKKSTTTESTTTTSETVSSSETSESTRESSEEPVKDEETRNGAVKAMTDMLKLFNEAPTEGMTLADRANLLTADDIDYSQVFTTEAWSHIYLTDFMGTDPRGRKLAAQAILTVLNSIQTVGNTDYTAVDVDYSGVVYFDKDLNVAYVPVDLYTSSATNLSFELLYIDGYWTLQPYTLITQIAIKNADNASLTNTPEAATEDSTTTSESTTTSTTASE